MVDAAGVLDFSVTTLPVGHSSRPGGSMEYEKTSAMPRRFRNKMREHKYPCGTSTSPATGSRRPWARVNRVFKDKPGGLVVDYLGLADQLKQALATYTESGGKGNPTYDTAQAIAVMQEKYEVACGFLHGFDWGAWTAGTGSARAATRGAGAYIAPAGLENSLRSCGS